MKKWTIKGIAEEIAELLKLDTDRKADGFRIFPPTMGFPDSVYVEVGDQGFVVTVEAIEKWRP